MARHDTLRPEAGLPWEIEQRLAALAGVEPTPRPVNAGEPVLDVVGTVDPEAVSEPEFARRVLRVAEIVTLGSFVLLVVAALLAARFGDGSLRVHEIPFAAWGLAAIAAAVTLAASSGDAYATAMRPARRRFL